MRLLLTLIIAICGTINLNAQTEEFSNSFFSFKIHDDLKLTEIEGIPVYNHSTFFLNIKEHKNYPSARKFSDAYYLKLGDDIQVTEGTDTLDGWPVISFHTEKKSDIGTFIQNFYFFDNGSSTFVLSMSGWRADQGFIDNYFAVTKKSFKFKTASDYLGELYINVPLIMKSERSTRLIWSRVYMPKSNTDIPIRFNRKADEKYDDVIEEQLKILKKNKSVDLVNMPMKVGNLSVTKVAGSYINKLDSGIKKEERRVMYVVKHPAGGVSYFFVVDDTKLVSIMETGMDNMIQSLRTERF